MKRFYAILLVFLLSNGLVSAAFAYKLADKPLLEAADLYAVTHRNLDWDSFFAPWTVFEEKSAVLKPPAERAVVYTPFLLVAMEKKQYLNQNQALIEAKVDDLLKSYEGNFVVCTVLRGRQANFTELLTAVLQQDNRVIKPHYIHADTPMAVVENGQTVPALYESRVYFYFPQAQVNLNLPASLLVFEQGQNARRFSLVLANIS